MSIARSKTLSLRAGWLWAAWLLALTLWTLALVTPYPVQVKHEVMPQETGIPAGKVLHVAAYAFLAAFAAFLPLNGGRRWLPLLVLSLHGFGTELCQLFVPLRTASLLDVGLDHAGILLGILLTLNWWRPLR